MLALHGSGRHRRDRRADIRAVVGNPPYRARKPAYKEGIYRRLYGEHPQDRRAGSIATGAHDTYPMFFANGIERLREGGRLRFIT